MCGRFTLVVDIDELFAYFDTTDARLVYEPRYNIAPFQQSVAVLQHEGRNRIGRLQWGLIPSWAKDEKIASMTINAKAETIRDKPAFRDAFIRRRCLIPADGFYEWKKTDGKQKQPMRITLKDEGLFAMAGLYDTWVSPDGRKLHTFTIITTRPNELMAETHDRMPVIIHKKHEHVWLNRELRDPSALTELLKPYPADRMKAYPVSPKVGSVKNDDASCITPVEPPALLF